MEELLGKLAEHSIAAALLVMTVRYLLKKNEKLEAKIELLNNEIKALNEEQKEEQKEYINKTVNCITENTTVMGKLIDKIIYGKK